MHRLHHIRSESCLLRQRQSLRPWRVQCGTPSTSDVYSLRQACACASSHDGLPSALFLQLSCTFAETSSLTGHEQTTVQRARVGDAHRGFVALRIKASGSEAPGASPDPHPAPRCPCVPHCSVSLPHCAITCHISTWLGPHISSSCSHLSLRQALGRGRTQCMCAEY